MKSNLSDILHAIVDELFVSCSVDLPIGTILYQDHIVNDLTYKLLNTIYIFTQSVVTHSIIVFSITIVSCISVNDELQ